MPDLVVAGNWKMNTTVSEAAALAAGVRDGAAGVTGVELVLCPPAVSLVAVSDAVKGSAVKVGAQNMHFQESGAFTGEVSPGMLQGICDYVIIGHSERRQMFAETDESVNLKIKAAQAAGLRPIMCVGETLEQREAGQASDFISGQVHAGLEGITDATGLVVAYEPIWAIGTGQSATPETAAEIIGGVILETLRSIFSGAAANISLLYGGSMNGGNAGDYAAQDCIHGGLIGGAALQADQFLQVATAVVAAKA
ncbi:MAG TPA: triose-phosphate isomerase [Dehalococcoidia bacterium]|jgi:triosephosphate isomerase|nr:triose-phosphate isomerase [Dehalococcoidia bacterium]HIL30652.1 triose-phosphate isomerase [Dehalococcoidia bacterium]